MKVSKNHNQTAGLVTNIFSQTNKSLAGTQADGPRKRALPHKVAATQLLRWVVILPQREGEPTTSYEVGSPPHPADKGQLQAGAAGRGRCLPRGAVDWQRSR